MRDAVWVTWASPAGAAHKVTSTWTLAGRHSLRTRCGARIASSIVRTADPLARKCATCAGTNKPPGRGRPRPSRRYDLKDTGEL